MRMVLPLTAEEQLLLVCARQTLNPADSSELEVMLQQPLQWGQVVAKAQWHRLSGLLFSHLRRPRYSPRLPGSVLQELQGLYYLNVARHLYVTTETTMVLEALQACGIPVMVLKGAALVNTVYADPGLRPMVDVDLLVPEVQVHEAQAAVCSLGYRPWGSPEDQEDAEKRHSHLPVLVGVGKPIVVEVHRHVVRLDSPLHFNIEGFWQRSREATVAGVRVQVPGTEDFLLHLSLNFLLHRRFRSSASLGDLCDIAETVRCYGDTIAWPTLVKGAREYGLAGPAALGLFLAQQLLDAPVPAQVLGQLRPQGFSHREVRRFVLRRVLGTQQWVAKELVSPGRPYTITAAMRAMPRRLLPSRRYMVSRYGPSARGKALYLRYFSRLGEGLAILMRLARRPWALREDVLVDRWMHSLYARGRGRVSPGDLVERAGPAMEVLNRVP